MTASRPLPETDVSALILAAMPEEAAPLLGRMDSPQELPSPLAGTTVMRGGLAGNRVVVMTTGIGISAASAATAWAGAALRPRVILSTGSTGGLAAGIDVGSVVVGREYSYSIADATAFGYAPGQVPGSPERFETDAALADQAVAAAEAVLARTGTAAGTGAPAGADVRSGLMLSGDAFVTAEIAEPMRARFPDALSADMESTGIVRTARALGIPAAVIRSVSDLCGPAADQQFHLALEVVAERAAAAVEELLRRLA